jgi:hypothetical protein
MRVSDFIRPSSRLRLRDIFGARLAPVAWSLDAHSLRSRARRRNSTKHCFQG